jgi:hypothetical protein
MRSKILVVLIAVALMGVSSAVMARSGGGGGGGGKGGSAGHVGHAHFGHAHFDHRLQRNLLLGGWGWGWPYGEGGYTNTTVEVSPQPVSRFPIADVTGSAAATPCHWNAETFTVPSSGGGNRPVQVVTCR